MGERIALTGRAKQSRWNRFAMELLGAQVSSHGGYARVGSLSWSDVMGTFERVIWIVLDSVGVGPLPDAADYGDVGRNTLGHIAELRPLQIPTLVKMGLANIAPLKHLTPPSRPTAAFGKG